MNNTLTTTNTTQALIESWLEAKEAEVAWQTHRRAIEAELADLHAEDIASMEERIEGSNNLSQKAALGEMVITVGHDLTADQTEAALLVQQYPHLANNGFKIEYKPMSRHILPLRNKGGSEVADRVRQITAFKPFRTSFAKL